MKIKFLISLLLLFLVGAVSAFGQETRFSVLASSNSSWVARGYSNYDVTPADSWSFVASRNFDNGVGFIMTGTPLSGTVVDEWTLQFAAPGDALITPGTYSDFERWPFQDPSNPGLEFGSTGRLDNFASGTFVVHEATYAGNGDVLTFSADITHYGEADTANWAMLEIRYNINNVPEPSGAILILASAGIAMVRRRR